MKHYIGIDLGKQSSYFVIKTGTGKLLKSMKVFNDTPSIQAALKGYEGPSSSAVIEACCNYYWMYQQLQNLQVAVKLAHPLKTRAIADAKVKNDRLGSLATPPDIANSPSFEKRQ
ncbi:MAG: hypothetical protein Q8Q33_06600 [Chlamydiota bacterium]|nr:hypothetical protein [Chlamydiota bacterium]